jgi:hypothetical protein
MPQFVPFERVLPGPRRYWLVPPCVLVWLIRSVVLGGPFIDSCNTLVRVIGKSHIVSLYDHSPVISLNLLFNW